jgi:AraC-like DNA-binding protein
MDRLESLLQRFSLQASVFHRGLLCTAATFEADQDVGHVHVLKSGEIMVDTQGQGSQTIVGPALLFYMQPTVHTLRPSLRHEPTLVCGAIRFGIASGNPIGQALPNPMVVDLSNNQSLRMTLELMFAEAFEHHCGQQAALDRLCELLILQLLRHLMEDGVEQIGLMAGLADPRLSQALTAMHNQPAHDWTLASLASEAGMSRSRFALRFKDVVGIPAGEYLASWRVGLAQLLLKKGKPVNLVAHEVGYSGSAALARAFTAQLGCSPTAWLKSQ